MEEILNLPYGMTWGLLPGTKAAWGARLIFPDDLVWDRQGTAGDETLVEKTMEWLNEKVDMVHPERVWNRKTEEMERVIGDSVKLTRLGHARWKARQLYETGEMGEKDERGFVLYLDGQGGIIASPNRSFGYLYVAAYLYEALPNGCTPQSDGTEIARNKTINNYNKD